MHKNSIAKIYPAECGIYLYSNNFVLLLFLLLFVLITSFWHTSSVYGSYSAFYGDIDHLFFKLYYTNRP
jgi:hypothetical protein